MNEILISPVGTVVSSRSQAEDDNWDSERFSIVLDDRFDEDSLAGLLDFSHVEVIYHFDQADESKIVTGARHPRNNAARSKVGQSPAP